MANPKENTSNGGIDPDVLAKRLQTANLEGIDKRTDLLIKRAVKLHGLRTLLRDTHFQAYLARLAEAPHGPYLNIYTNRKYHFGQHMGGMHVKKGINVSTMSFYFGMETGVHVFFPKLRRARHHNEPEGYETLNADLPQIKDAGGYRLYELEEFDKALHPKLRKDKTFLALVESANAEIRTPFHDPLDPRPLLQQQRNWQFVYPHTEVSVPIAQFDNLAAGNNIATLDPFDMNDVIDMVMLAMASGK